MRKRRWKVGRLPARKARRMIITGKIGRTKEVSGGLLVKNLQVVGIHAELLLGSSNESAPFLYAQEIAHAVRDEVGVVMNEREAREAWVRDHQVSRGDGSVAVMDQLDKTRDWKIARIANLLVQNMMKEG